MGDNHPATLNSLSVLAGLYQSQGKYAQALVFIQEALHRKYSFLTRELQGSSEKTRLKMLKEFEVSFERDRLFTTLENYPKEDYNRLALYFVANYKGILLRISQELKQMVTAKKNQQLIEQLSQKRSVYSSLSFHYQERRQNPQLVKKLEEEIESLEKQLIWQNSNAQNLFSATQPKEILEVLGQKELLVEFVAYRSIDFTTWQYQKNKLVAVVAMEGKLDIMPLRNLSVIANLLKRYRQKLQQQQQINKLAQQIYQKILAPLHSHLSNKNKVYLVPDGILHLLPFPSLIKTRQELGSVPTKSKPPPFFLLLRASKYFSYSLIDKTLYLCYTLDEGAIRTWKLNLPC